MNPSHSTTFSITDPSRAPSKTAETRSSSQRAGDSFSAFYHREAASFDEQNQSKARKNNDIEKMDEKRNASLAAQKDASHDADTHLRAEDNEGALAVDESILQGDKDEISALAGHDLASQDQTFETELLHGISITLPSNSSQTKGGEKFPLSGKELPPSGAQSEQEMLLLRPTAESELPDVVARTDTGIQIRGRSDVSKRDDSLISEKVVDLTSIRSDSSRNEMIQAKALSEPLPESLSLLGLKSWQDPATTLTAGNNSPTNMAAVVSQVDSMAAQKLSVTADTAATSDLSASARGSSFDKSDALGEKIHWMRNANISIAELHLHPAELGSIEIKIVTEDQQARISFITSSATARDVIEESLPKLRELLADSGLALDQSDISQKDNSDEQARKDQQTLPENRHIEREIENKFTTSLISTRVGQVDHYV